MRAHDPLGYVWELRMNLVVVRVVVAGPLKADLKVAVAILTSFDQFCMYSPLMLHSAPTVDSKEMCGRVHVGIGPLCALVRKRATSVSLLKREECREQRMDES